LEKVRKSESAIPVHFWICTFGIHLPWFVIVKNCTSQVFSFRTCGLSDFRTALEIIRTFFRLCIETSTFAFLFVVLNRRISMFKYLLIFGIFFYVLYKIGSFFFRAGAASQQLRNYQRQQQQQQAEREKQTQKSVRNDRRGGEYIDYEEVK
jgi:hypothetical protein